MDKIIITYFDDDYNHPSIDIRYSFEKSRIRFVPHAQFMRSCDWSKLLQCMTEDTPYEMIDGTNGCVAVSYEKGEICFTLESYGGNAGGMLTTTLPCNTSLVVILGIVHDILLSSESGHIYQPGKTPVEITFQHC